MGVDVNVSVDEQEITDRVVEEVARRIVDRTDLYEIAERAVIAKIEAMAEVKIVEAIDAAFERPFQPTSKYGERKGEKHTIREMIIDKVQSYLVADVGWNGRPADSCSSDKKKRVQYLIAKQVEAVFAANIASLVKAEVENFPKEIGDIVTKAVKSGLKGGISRMK